MNKDSRKGIATDVINTLQKTQHAEARMKERVSHDMKIVGKDFVRALLDNSIYYSKEGKSFHILGTLYRYILSEKYQLITIAMRSYGTRYGSGKHHWQYANSTQRFEIRMHFNLGQYYHEYHNIQDKNNKQLSGA